MADRSCSSPAPTDWTAPIITPATAPTLAFLARAASAVSDAPGWCSVMAYAGSALVGLAIFGRGHSPMSRRHRSGTRLDFGDDAGGHRGLDDVVAVVVLAGDAVEGLHVDGWERPGRRFQLRPTVDAGSQTCRLTQWTLREPAFSAPPLSNATETQRPICATICPPRIWF